MTQPTILVKDATGIARSVFSINPNGPAAQADSQPVVLPTDQAFAIASKPGANLWPMGLDACPLDSGNTRVANFGPGPFPGDRSVQLTLSGYNEGCYTGSLNLHGRTDGAMFYLGVWLLGTGQQIELNIQAVGVASGVREVVASQVITVPATWTLFVIRGYVSQFDCSTITAAIRSNNNSGSRVIQACRPDFRLLTSQEIPEYEPPIGSVQDIYVTCRLSTSYAAWGDSLTGGSGYGQWHPELQRILLGCPYYNGGVGGQTSTQIKDRFIATDDATKMRRSFGVQIIWAGNNNIADEATWKADIDTMVSNMVHGRYLIVSNLSGNNDHTSGLYPHLLESYRYLRSRFGARFVDQEMLLRCGTEFDIAALRGDAIHPNPAGLGMEAHEFYRSMRRNGYLDGTVAGALDWGDSADRECTHPIAVSTNIPAAVTVDIPILGIGRRKGFIIVNDTTTGVMYLTFGWHAGNTWYTKKLMPGESWEFIGHEYHGPVSAYWSVADGAAYVTEIV